ncbi:hypothetical protein Tco_0348976 [Tanacetum coccineum]
MIIFLEKVVLLGGGYTSSQMSDGNVHVIERADSDPKWIGLRELLHNNDKQELVSREKRTHDYEQIADLACKLGLPSRLYVKALRPFVVYYTFWLEALQSPDQVVFLVRSVTRLGLPIVGTGIDEKKNCWFKWPEWLPIQVLDEEA